MSNSLPVTLKDGESAWFMLELEKEKFHALLDKPFALSSRLLTFFASDALGNEFHVKPSKDLRKHMQEAAENAANAKVTC
jgi:hypothetical protein